MPQLKLANLLFLISVSSGLLTAQSSERAIDVEHSTMTIHVFKTGMFSFAGDNHEIRAPLVSGRVDQGKRTVELTVDARKMKVLDPKMSESKRAQVQEKMLSPEVLDPERYPEIKFQSTDVKGSGQQLTVTGDLTLHGQTHPVVVAATGGDSGYKGKATIKQTDFGMKPVTVGGGTVKVKDEVEIEFEIVLK
jgi:polyisoprenoid-binding protein YceI